MISNPPIPVVIEGENYSKFIWKDIPEQALYDANRTVSLVWTPLDLSAYTSPNAKIAIVRLRIRADIVGTSKEAWAAVRKSSTTAAYYPRVNLDLAGTTPAVYKVIVSPIGLDLDRKIQYTINVGTGWQIDTRLSVSGYIE